MNDYQSSEVTRYSIVGWLTKILIIIIILRLGVVLTQACSCATPVRKYLNKYLMPSSLNVVGNCGLRAFRDQQPRGKHDDLRYYAAQLSTPTDDLHLVTCDENVNMRISRSGALSCTTLLRRFHLTSLITCFCLCSIMTER